MQDASGISAKAIHTRHAPPRRAHTVRTAFYEALVAQVLPRALWLRAPPLPDGPNHCQILGFQTWVAMAPFLVTPATFLSLPALRVWVLTHLRLPVFPPEL